MASLSPTQSETGPSVWERAKAYGANYIDNIDSPENIAKAVKQNPLGMLRLASATGQLGSFGSLSPGTFGPGGDGPQMAPAQGSGEWFNSPSSKPKPKPKDKKPGDKPKQPARWVFPALLTQPYTRIT